MACENGAWAWILVRTGTGQVLVDDQALGAVPDPDHDRRVTRAGRDEAVAVLGHLRAVDARDEVVVAEDDLDNLGRIGREHAEALVEESGGENVAVVVGDYEVSLSQL